MSGPTGDRASARVGSASVLAAAVLWGTTGVATTFAPGLTPLVIASITMGVGGALQALSAVGPVRRARPVLRAHRATLALGAGSVAVYPIAFYSSMRLAGVAVGSVVSIGSAPLASGLVDRFADGRPLSRRWAAGAGLGIAGLALLAAGSVEHRTSVDGAATTQQTVAGVLLGLVAGATYAVYTWAAHRLMRQGASSRGAMAAVFGLGAVALLPILVVSGSELTRSGTSLAVAAYLVVVPMWAGYLLFGWGLARVPASSATTLSLVEPAVAAVLAVLVVGERLQPVGWVGIGLTLGCLVLLSLPRLPARAAVWGRQPSTVSPSG